MSIFIGLGLLCFLLLGAPLYIVVIALSAHLFLVGDIPLAATVISFKKLELQEFLSAIPLFTYVGYALSQSKAPRRILNVSEKWLGGFVGSGTTITVLVMALFTALTGASGVSILALGSLMYPLLIKASKNEQFSYGLITGSGSIGLLLAPSLPVIIYGIIANQNSNVFNSIDIDQLFQAALLPTAILLLLYIGYGTLIEYLAQKKPGSLAPPYKRFVFREAMEALYDARYEIPLPLLVYGGIYWGFFSVLEASLGAFLYTMLILFVIRKEFSFRKDFIPFTVAAMKLSGGIFIIMASAFVLTNYLVNARVPDQVFNWAIPYLTNPYTFLIAINIFLLLAGCVIDIFSAILIILPLVLPLVERYGIHPYHFAIVFLVNLEIGYITPPVGLNLFIASYRFKKDILFMYRATIPFFFILLLSLILFTYVPILSTFTIDRPFKLFSSQTEKADEEAPRDNVAPSRIKKLEVTSRSSTSLTLTFLPSTDRTGSPSLESDASTLMYKLVYIDEEMNELELIEDLGEEHFLMPEELTMTAGSYVTTLKGLLPETPYSLVILAIDSSGNISFPSEIVIAETKP